MLPPPSPSQTAFDIAIVGAGPVGLAIAAELARSELSVIVLDKRPPLDQDTLRPQMLVAREGDLGNLASVGVDLSMFSRIQTMCRSQHPDDELECGGIDLGDDSQITRDLVELASQKPAALVPIGDLQRALAKIAAIRGATIAYALEVESIRRHAHRSSLTFAFGYSLTAKLVILATGAARSLVSATPITRASQRMIAGVFATTNEPPTWTRFPVHVRGFARPARATVLTTESSGTAVLVTTPRPRISDDELHTCFDAVCKRTDLTGESFLAPPRPFVTTVSSVHRRVLAGDRRAPIVIAGDAAQTGHVFTGQTCFMNLALGLALAKDIVRTRAFVNDRPSDVMPALERYEKASVLGATLLAELSNPHLTYADVE